MWPRVKETEIGTVLCATEWEWAWEDLFQLTSASELIEAVAPIVLISAQCLDPHIWRAPRMPPCPSRNRPGLPTPSTRPIPRRNRLGFVNYSIPGESQRPLKINVELHMGYSIRPSDW